jgi:hypothetical protein
MPKTVNKTPKNRKQNGEFRQQNEIHAFMVAMNRFFA